MDLAPPYGPEHRTALLDAIVAYLAKHGVSTLSLRPLAQALGYSTRVLTYHFTDKEQLVASALARLDERQRQRLRSLPGWQERTTTIGAAIRATWDWQLDEENLPFTRLVHEIEGLAAGGRLAKYVQTLLTDRIEFVAETIRAHGVPEHAARHYAMMINATYTGLQIDYLNTGDTERTSAGIETLAALADEWALLR